MKHLIDGVRRFRNDVYPPMQTQFKQLAEGQKPHTLFITCADSRIDPCLITQSAPGDIFVHRNPGNLVPKFGDTSGGEAASIEYAVCVLGVSNIVVCGHSQCGAVAGLANPESLEGLDHVGSWLQHAGDRTQASQNPIPGSDDPLLALAGLNAVVQLDHLIGYPCVRGRVASGDLGLHAWVYVIQDGEILVFQPSNDRFVPLAEIEK